MKRLRTRLFALALLGLLGVYAVDLYGRGSAVYAHLGARAESAWVGERLWEWDAEFGFSPVPGARVTELVPQSEGVPVRLDARGLRVPEDWQPEPADDARPALLALGCSFTFGTACRAEQTWPAVAGERLGARVLNAGIPAGGLAHMLLRARRILAEEKPTWVVAQYAPWLAPRATSLWARTQTGPVPVPYLVEAEDGGYRVHPPQFQSQRLEPEIQPYRTSERSRGMALRFAWEVALPMLLSEDWHQFRMGVGERMGTLARPAADGPALRAWAYEELRRMAHEAGAEFCVLVVGEDVDPLETRFLDELPETPVVQGTRKLYQRLPAQHFDAYFAAYGHWGGDPPRLVDQHPNPLAHELLGGWVADALIQLEVLRRRTGTRPGSDGRTRD